MKQVIGLYRKVAWILLLLGIWIISGYCVRLLHSHPYSSVNQLVINMLLLGGAPVGIALFMFRNLIREKKKKKNGGNKKAADLD